MEYKHSRLLAMLSGAFFATLSMGLCALVCDNDVTFAQLAGQAPGVCPQGEVYCCYTDRGDGATVERVHLYAKEREDSPREIVRNGILYRYKDAVGTVLICHGFMCDKDDVGFLRLNLFTRGKYNVMTFDFRAHGDESEGQWCTLGLHEANEVVAAAKFLKSHPELQGKPLFSYGFSMGAVASIQAQSREKLFDAMILDCPFDSSETVVKTGLDKLKFQLFGYEFDLPGKGVLHRYAFQPYVQSFLRAALKAVAYVDTKDIPISIEPFSAAESARTIDAPCLFIHCKNDDKVPVSSIRAVFDNVTGYKKLWITNGRYHFDSFFSDPERYADRVKDFLDRVQNKKLDMAENGSVIEDPSEL